MGLGVRKEQAQEYSGAILSPLAGSEGIEEKDGVGGLCTVER